MSSRGSCTRTCPSGSGRGSTTTFRARARRTSATRSARICRRTARAPDEDVPGSGRHRAAAPVLHMSLLASFDWSTIWDNRGALAEGLWRTVQVSIIGIVLATAIGLVLGAIRAYRIPVLSQLGGVYVEVIRNTPILVQIVFVFYALPTIHAINLGFATIHLGRATTISGFTAACVAVTVWGGAFNTENFRAGFGAVPFRCREAAAALGFGRLGPFLRVTFPIGSRIALP